MTARVPPVPPTLEVPVLGMDCGACARKVQKALDAGPGVESAEVLLSAEKVVVTVDPAQVDLTIIRKAVAGAGYTVPLPAEESAAPAALDAGHLTRPLFTLLGVLVGVILFVVVVGERLGLFSALTERVPWPVGLAAVLAFGYPIFRGVLRSALRLEVTSHTLMSVGAVAALVVGEWATAAVVVFFMRVGDYAERFTTERARQSLKTLTALAPQIARVERQGRELEVPIAEVRAGETVVVRPGEKIPVDGEVVSGQATVDQAAITGESMPIKVEAGSSVHAATVARLGAIKVRATRVGADTTFGRTVRLVEEAEAHRGPTQRLADRFSALYLPVVAVVAALTYLLGRDPLATTAVLVVACSCSFALATPIAMLASIGAAARRGLLVKGGAHLETLARADVLLVDKTGTLTLGRSKLTDVVALGDVPEATLLRLAASAERYSEHPLAGAVRRAAAERGLEALAEPEGFEALPGLGVRAQVEGVEVAVGNRRLVPEGPFHPRAAELEARGKTLLFVALDGRLAGVLAAADEVRPELPEALAALGALGVGRIELLTGDNERSAAALAGSLGIGHRANLLPEDKIAIVREHQARGQRVVFVGDGVNDAPALAQADVGIAMGGGTDVALEAAHVALVREDWRLVADAFRVARRTMGVVRVNIGFTAAYNVVGLTLAALGLLPPIFAAALQSLPDLGILANSSRLVRQR